MKKSSSNELNITFLNYAYLTGTVICIVLLALEQLFFIGKGYFVVFIIFPFFWVGSEWVCRTRKKSQKNCDELKKTN